MILQVIVYLRLSIYGCFLFIVHNKEKTFILFLGIYPPYPRAPRITLGIYTSCIITGILPGVFAYMGSLRSPNTCPHIKPLYGANGATGAISLSTTRSQGAMGDVSPRGTFRFPQSMVTLRLAIAAQTK